MMVGGLNQAGRALRRLIETAQRMVTDGELMEDKGDEPPVRQTIVMGDGEEDEAQGGSDADDEDIGENIEEDSGDGGGSPLLH
jgi:hypothetical protein